MIRVIIQNNLYQNKNREEVKNREIRSLISLFLTSYLFFVLVKRILNYYPTHLLNFGEVETPYSTLRYLLKNSPVIDNDHVSQLTRSSANLFMKQIL